MAEFDDLEETLRKLRAEVGEFEELPNQIQEELEQIPVLEKELNDLSGDLAKEVTIGQQVSQNRSQLEEEVARLREKHAEVSSRGEAWKKEYEEAVALRNELNAKINEARERLEAEMAKNDQTEARCAELASENEILIDMLGPAPGEIDALRQRLEELDADCQEIMAHKEKIELQIQEHTVLFNRFKTAFAAVGLDLDEGLEEESIEKVTAHLQEERASLEAQIAQKLKENHALEGDAHAALIESEKLVIGHNLGLMKHENNELQAQLDGLHAQIQERTAGADQASALTQKIQEHQQRLKALDAEHQAAQALQAQVDALETQVRQKQEELATLREASQLSQQIQEQHARISSLESEKQSVLASIKDLSDLSSSTSLDALKARNAQLIQHLNQKQHEAADAASFERLQETVISTLELIQSSLAQSIDAANQQKVLPPPDAVGNNSPRGASSSTAANIVYPPVPHPVRHSICQIL